MEIDKEFQKEIVKIAEKRKIKPSVFGLSLINLAEQFKEVLETDGGRSK